MDHDRFSTADDLTPSRSISLGQILRILRVTYELLTNFLVWFEVEILNSGCQPSTLYIENFNLGGGGAENFQVNYSDFGATKYYQLLTIFFSYVLISKFCFRGPTLNFNYNTYLEQRERIV